MAVVSSVDQGLLALTGGQARFEVQAATVRAALRQIDALHPGVLARVEAGMAIAIDGEIHQEGLLARVQALGQGLRERLVAAFGEHPHVGDLRGRGLMQAIELVADRTSKAPFNPALRLHARIKSEAMARGLMVYPMGGTIDGRQGDHVLLAPPFITTEAELDAIVDRLKQAVQAALEATH